MEPGPQFNVESVARIAAEMGLLGGEPIVDAIDAASLDVDPPSDPGDAIPPNRIAQYRQDLERKLEDDAQVYARVRTTREQEHLTPYSNADAYSEGVRVLYNGAPVVLPGDAKRKEADAYLGVKAEPSIIARELMNATKRPIGAHGSNSKGRTRGAKKRLADAAERARRFDQETAHLEGLSLAPDAVDEAMRAMRESEAHLNEYRGGRRRIGKEPRMFVGGRAEPSHIQTLRDAGISVSHFIGNAIAAAASSVKEGLLKQSEETTSSNFCSAPSSVQQSFNETRTSGAA